MSKFNAYVETVHGMKVYEVVAASEGEAKRLSEDYGHVRYVIRTGTYYGAK